MLELLRAANYTHQCSAAINDATFRHTWVPISCTQTYRSPVFICEYNPQSTPRTNSRQFITRTSHCSENMVFTSEQCIHLIKVNNRSCNEIQVRDDFYQGKQYLTSWTKSFTKREVLITKNESCTCLSTRQNNHLEGLAEWTISNCNCNISYGLCTGKIMVPRVQCSSTNWRCGDGLCIKQYYRCDGRKDCSDGSDEHICPNSCVDPSKCMCSDSYYRCFDGLCLDVARVCDGITDCTNNDDEENCIILLSYIEESSMCETGCQLNEQCSMWSVCAFIGLKHSCVPNSQICVYDRNIFGETKFCSHTEHLRFCIHHKCPHMFKCKNTYCIPLHHVCDGVADCHDSADEEQCHELICPGYLKCRHDSICVHPLHICDQIVHCKISEDDEKYCHVPLMCDPTCKCDDFQQQCSGILLSLNGAKKTRVLELRNVQLDLTSSLVLDQLLVLLIFQKFIDLKKIKLRHLKYLKLVDIHLDELMSFSFISLRNIHVLSFADCTVRKIEEHTIHEMSNILHLNLSFIDLIQLKEQSFSGTIYVQTLYLNNNNLIMLPNKLFQYMKQLQLLDLKCNKLHYLPVLLFPDKVSFLVVKTDNQALCCEFDRLKNNTRCLPKIISRSSHCNSIINNKMSALCMCLFSVTIVLINATFAPYKLYNLSHKFIRLVHYNLVFSNISACVYFLIIVKYDYSLKNKYYFINYIWNNSFICQFSSLILHFSVLNSTLSHTLLASNTWFLVKYPLRRQGLSKEYILYSLLMSWLVIVLILLASISQTYLPIHCFLFLKSNNVMMSTKILYIFIQTYILISFVLLVYFYLSIIIISHSLINTKISSSLERKMIFTQLIKSALINVFLSVVITVQYIVIVLVIFVRRDDDEDLLMIFLYTFMSSLYSFVIFKQIHPRRTHRPVKDIKLEVITETMSKGRTTSTYFAESS